MMKKIISYLFRRENLRAIAIGVAVIGFVWFAVFGDQGLYRLHRSLKLRAELKQEIAGLKQKVEDLKKEKELLYNPTHLELIIRQELGYVKPGEVVFIPQAQTSP